VLVVRKEDGVKFDPAVIVQAQCSVLAVEAFSSISLGPSKGAAVQLVGDYNCYVRSQKIVWCPHAKVRVDVPCPPDSIFAMEAR
jgi:hypothetical protein